MGLTATHLLRYPELADAPNVPLDMAELAADLEAELGTRIAAGAVLDTGQVGQRRAGRVLVPADFTDLGLAAPAGLWNLTDLTDASGNSRALSNKGSVPFGKGITGATTEAAVFAGSTAQALYRADEAALRIGMGSLGCWFRTGKRSTDQMLMSAWHPTVANRRFYLALTSGNLVAAAIGTEGTGSQQTATGTTDGADDRWHFAVMTNDGTMTRLYVDGVLEASLATGPMNVTAGAVFNIGAAYADGGTAAISPSYGRIDEAFLTPEVLTEDQIRLLMCVKLTHGATRTPRRAGVMVRRRRRGVVLAASDFTGLGLAQPKRIYNLSHATGPGDYGGDLGSDGLNLTQVGSPAFGIAGPDGKGQGAVNFDGATQYLHQSDTGLPSGTAARTLLAWFKTTLATGTPTIISYGGSGTDELLYVNAGAIYSRQASSTVFAADGQWHFAALVGDNAAADGVKTKLYLDGRLVGGSTLLSAITLAGATAFRIGYRTNGTGFFAGQLARAVVSAEAPTPDQIAAIYAKGSQDLGLSPYNAGDYVERLDATGLYVLADRGTLEDQEQVELEVAA